MSAREETMLDYQQQTRVYVNAMGYIVIQQEDMDGTDDDFVAISPQHLDALLIALESKRQSANDKRAKYLAEIAK